MAKGKCLGRRSPTLPGVAANVISSGLQPSDRPSTAQPTRRIAGLHRRIAVGAVAVMAIGCSTRVRAAGQASAQPPVLVSVPMTMTSPSSYTGSPADLTAIEQQVANAIYLHYHELVPALRPTGGQKYSTTFAQAGAKITSSADYANLPTVFTAGQLHTEQQQVAYWARLMSTGAAKAWPLDGGVDWIHYDSVVVGNKTAQVAGSAYVFSQSIGVLDDGTFGSIDRPADSEEINATLVILHGAWMVTTFSWTSHG